MSEDYGIDCTFIIQSSFNLTRVSAQLERLMGTNVVRLTDCKYMMELRQRINEDFNDMLTRRIESREVKEMERQRNLYMEGKITKCSEEYNNQPMFIVNQAMNQPAAKRRTKLKTNRQKNAERLMRQGAKWEKERNKLNEVEKLRELEEKAKQTAVLNMVIDFQGTNKEDLMDLLRLRNSGSDTALNFKELSDEDNEKSSNRSGNLKGKDRPINSLVKSQDSDELLSAKNSQISKEYYFNQLEDDYAAEGYGKKLNKSSGNTPNTPRAKIDPNNIVYEDPMVSELKQTESVKDMYKLANEILCGIYGSKATVSEDSDCNDEVSDDSPN